MTRTGANQSSLPSLEVAAAGLLLPDFNFQATVETWDVYEKLNFVKWKALTCIFLGILKAKQNMSSEGTPPTGHQSVTYAIQLC